MIYNKKYYDDLETQNKKVFSSMSKEEKEKFMKTSISAIDFSHKYPEDLAVLSFTIITYLKESYGIDVDLKVVAALALLIAYKGYEIRVKEDMKELLK